MGKKILLIAMLLVCPLLALAQVKYHGTVTYVAIGEETNVPVLSIDNKLFQLSNGGVKVTVNDISINVSELQSGMVVRYSINGAGSIYRIWVIGPKKLIDGMLNS